MRNSLKKTTFPEDLGLQDPSRIQISERKLPGNHLRLDIIRGHCQQDCQGFLICKVFFFTKQFGLERCLGAMMRNRICQIFMAVASTIRDNNMTKQKFRILIMRIATNRFLFMGSSFELCLLDCWSAGIHSMFPLPESGPERLAFRDTCIRIT